MREGNCKLEAGLIVLSVLSPFILCLLMLVAAAAYLKLQRAKVAAKHELQLQRGAAEREALRPTWHTL